QLRRGRRRRRSRCGRGGWRGLLRSCRWLRSRRAGAGRGGQLGLILRPQRSIGELRAVGSKAGFCCAWRSASTLNRVGEDLSFLRFLAGILVAVRPFRRGADIFAFPEVGQIVVEAHRDITKLRGRLFLVGTFAGRIERLLVPRAAETFWTA